MRGLWIVAAVAALTLLWGQASAVDPVRRLDAIKKQPEFVKLKEAVDKLLYSYQSYANYGSSFDLLGVNITLIKEAVMQIRKIISPLICVLAQLPATQEEVDACYPCIESLQLLFDETVNMKPWAIYILDAILKPYPGILQGNFAFMSSYDACYKVPSIDISDKLNDFDWLRKDNITTVSSTYCTANMGISVNKTGLDNMSFNSSIMDLLLGELESLDDINQLLDDFPGFLSLCLPSACSVNGLNAITKTLLFVLKNDKLLPDEIKLKADFLSCKNKQQAEELALTSTEKGALAVLLIFVAVVVISTGFDAVFLAMKKNASEQVLTMKSYETEKSTPVAEALRSFSVYTNFQKLMDTSAPRGSLRSVFGLKVLSFFWVIIGATLTLRAYNLTVNLKDLRDALKMIVVQFAINPSLSLDSIFTLLGIVLGYRLTKTFYTKDSKRGIARFTAKFLLHKLIRLIPVYYICLFLLTVLFPVSGGGPTWEQESQRYLKNCHSNWWWNILFINNFLFRQDQCMEHTWYFALAVQGLFCSIIVAVLWQIRPIYGHAAAGALVLSSFLSTVILTSNDDLGPTSLLREYRPGSRDDYFNMVEIRPYTRGGVLIIGLVAGYFLAIRKGTPFPKNAALAGWLLSLTAVLAFIHSPYNWNSDLHKRPSTAGAAVYAGFHRLLWATAVSWIVMACAAKQGGVFSQFLSWSGWLPLSRLTYGLYIIYPFVIFYTNGTSRIAKYYSLITMLQDVVWNLLISTVCAVVLHLLFEAPFLRLDELVCPLNRDEDEEDEPEPFPLNAYGRQISSKSQTVPLDNPAFTSDKI